MPPGMYPGRPALSETSSELSRVREVIPGPSPAFISTTVDPACLPPVDLHSQHISHLSDAGPSRSDPITIHEDSWVHVSVSSHSPVQGQDPDLSALDIPPLTPEGQTVTANVEVLSPTPRMHINSLPTIAARQVPLPESRPASVIGSVLSLFGAKSILSRPRGEKIKLDVGIDATQHQASTTDWERPIAGQEQHQPSAMIGHRRMNSGPGPSMLRHADDDDESVVGSLVGKGSRTEPIFGGRPESLLGNGREAFVGGFSADVNASEAFVGGFAVKCTTNEFATQSGIASQPLSAPGQSEVPSRNPPMNSSQTPTPTDAPIMRSTITDPQPPDWVPPSNTDSISGANISTTADNPLSNPISNADDPASNQNLTVSAAQRKKKRAPKNTQTASQGAPPGPPETTPQDQQQTSSCTQTPGPDSQNPAGSASDPLPTPQGLTQDAAVPVQRTTEIDTNTTKHIRGVQGPDFPDSGLNSPPPPFKEVATPIEPTLLTQEQTERESLRGEFLMRELKQLEMLIAKAESGTGRGSPSAMSVERLNGLKERFGMVRGRVERRVYEDPSTESETPPQLTLSGIDGPSAVDLVHIAIVDMLLETPHAEPLALVGYINKQKRGNGKVAELKNAVVDWVKENKFKVRNDPATPFILNITF